MRSGYVHLPGVNEATLSFISQGGVGWSSYGASKRYDDTATLSAYYLNFGAMSVNVSRGPDSRWFGYPLRCLSTVLDM